VRVSFDTRCAGLTTKRQLQKGRRLDLDLGARLQQSRNLHDGHRREMPADRLAIGGASASAACVSWKSASLGPNIFGRTSDNEIIQHERRHKDHLHVRFFNRRAQEHGRIVYPVLIESGMAPPPSVRHRVRSGETLGSIPRAAMEPASRRFARRTASGARGSGPGARTRFRSAGRPSTAGRWSCRRAGSRRSYGPASWRPTDVRSAPLRRRSRAGAGSSCGSLTAAISPRAGRPLRLILGRPWARRRPRSSAKTPDPIPRRPPRLTQRRAHAVDYRNGKESAPDLAQMLERTGGERRVPVIVESGKVTIGYGGGT